MSNKRRSLILSLLFLGLMGCTKTETESTATPGFERDHGQAGVQDEISDPNILQIAMSSPNHTTLVAGVKAAKLENVLVGAGPLTVFAPSNAAFDKLPDGTLESLLKPENKSTLSKIITSHASPGTFTGEGLRDGMQLYMATGHYLDVKVNEAGTFVNGSKILASLKASNGVIHVIDDVFLIAL